jgi:hypothetical protein
MAEEEIPSRGRPKLRRRLTLLLVVLACLGVAVSGVAVWLHSTLLVTDRWVETTAPIIEDPDVQRDVAERVGQEVVTALDLEARAREALPPDLDILAAPLALRVEDVISREAREFMASPEAYRLWTEANRIAHTQIVKLLREEPGFLYAEGDLIRLNVLPIVTRVMAALKERIPRLFPDVATVPVVTAETPPEEAIRRLETAFARDLPPDFGQVELTEADRLDQAQAAVKLFDRTVWLLVLATAGLIAAAILYSPRRLRTALQLGAGSAIALALVLLVDSWLEAQLLAAVTERPGNAAARTAITSIVGDFSGFLRILLIGAALVAVAAYIASRGELVASVAGRGRDELARRRTTTGVLATHLDCFRLAGVVLGLVVVVAVVPSWPWGLVLIAAVAAYELLLSWLTYTWPWGAGTRAESPAADA